jgi:hypothetical protein
MSFSLGLWILKGLNAKLCSEPAELYAEKPQRTAEPINDKLFCEPLRKA